MVTTVVKTIGASGADYTTLVAWEDAPGLDLTITRSNTTQSGSTSSTIKLDASASATSTDYVGHAIWCDARPTEKRLITAYDGGTKVATIGVLNGSSATWANTPGVEAYTLDSVIWQGQIKDATDTFANPGLYVRDRTTSATCYRELTTAAGASFRDNVNVRTNALRFNSSNGARITCSASFDIAVQVLENYFRMSNIQFNSSGSTSSCMSVIGTGVIIDNCIIEGYYRDHLTQSSGVIQNCLVVHTQSGLAYGVTFEGTSAINCTFVIPSDLTAATDLIHVGNFATPNFKNCAFFGCANVWSGNGAPTFTNCYTDDASPPTGCANAAYDTSTGSGFVATVNASGDFRIGSASALVNAGTATGAPGYDISNLTRPSGAGYDVGAWEYASGGAAATSAPARRAFPFSILQH